MQLIISSKAVSPNHPFLVNFKRYKYRNEVSLLMDLPEAELALITAASYAFIYPAVYEDTTLLHLRAMQCEVPVITTNTKAISDIAGDAALYANPADFEDLADKMMLLFKDENKRSELINHGKLIIEKINKTEDPLWKSISDTVQGKAGGT